MKVLITGAAGDFGRDLAPWLADKHEIRCTDMHAPDHDLEFVAADLTVAESIEGLCDGCDAVIHLAALLPKASYTVSQYVDVNTKAVGVLAEEAVRAGVPRLIYVSTVWATGHGVEEGVFQINEETPPTPVCLYGVAKYGGEVLAEYYARNYGLQTLIVRACGYLRHPDAALDGTIDWPNADLASLAGRLTQPGGKPFNPADLGHFMDAALQLPDLTCERLLFGISTPFTAGDADLCRQDIVAAWDKYYPGAAECFAALDFTPPTPASFYDNSRSRQRLGFADCQTLADVVAEWQRREGRA